MTKTYEHECLCPACMRVFTCISEISDPEEAGFEKNEADGKIIQLCDDCEGKYTGLSI